MQTFIDFLQKFKPISPASCVLIKERVEEKFLRTDEYFLQAGEVCKELGFVVQGVVRLFYCDRFGNEFTRFFVKEQHFAVNLSSFNDQTPSSEYLQAETDCRLLCLSKKDMDYLYGAVPEWAEVIRKITEKALLEKMALKTKFFEVDGTQRYLNFVAEHPDLLQKLPLSHIASFLGVTQSSLSRIRKSVASGTFLPNGKN
jgi:CRP-like cAMP-binding protein